MSKSIHITQQIKTLIIACKRLSFLGINLKPFLKIRLYGNLDGFVKYLPLKKGLVNVYFEGVAVTVEGTTCSEYRVFGCSARAGRNTTTRSSRSYSGESPTEFALSPVKSRRPAPSPPPGNKKRSKRSSIATLVGTGQSGDGSQFRLSPTDECVPWPFTG